MSTGSAAKRSRQPRSAGVLSDEFPAVVLVKVVNALPGTRYLLAMALISAAACTRGEPEPPYPTPVGPTVSSSDTGNQGAARSQLAAAPSVGEAASVDARQEPGPAPAVPTDTGTAARPASAAKGAPVSSAAGTDASCIPPSVGVPVHNPPLHSGCLANSSESGEWYYPDVRLRESPGAEWKPGASQARARLYFQWLDREKQIACLRYEIRTARADLHFWETKTPVLCAHLYPPPPPLELVEGSLFVQFDAPSPDTIYRTSLVVRCVSKSAKECLDADLAMAIVYPTTQFWPIVHLKGW